VSLTSLYMAVMMSDTRYVYALGVGLYIVIHSLKSGVCQL